MLMSEFSCATKGILKFRNQLFFDQYKSNFLLNHRNPFMIKITFEAVEC